MRFRKKSAFKTLENIYEIFNGNFEIIGLGVEFSALINY
jgi:hypothetical protein